MDIKIDNLLKKIKKSLEELKSNQKASEDFNIFSTLGVEILEMRHSKFLAELLDPNGTHGCKDLFLKQFLQLEPINKKIKDIDIDNFCKNAKVETEQFHIVEKNQSYIDIVIESKNTVIVIENKIYAVDQHKQLYRYHKAKQDEKFSNIVLVYLTLDGKEPNVQSLNNHLTINDIELLSYENHISEWLANTMELIEFNNIKIILNQYLTTLEKLTNKNSKEENMMIADKLIKDDDLQIAIKIANALPRAKAIFEIKFYEKLQKKLVTILDNYDYLFYDCNLNNDIERLIKARTPNSKKENNRFNGLHFYKKLQNGKYLFLIIGDDADDRLYCECFLSTEKNNKKIQKIRKSDFDASCWIVDNNYKITIEGENFPEVYFSGDNIYKKSIQEIDQIIDEIIDILNKILQSNDFKELENSFEKN